MTELIFTGYALAFALLIFVFGWAGWKDWEPCCWSISKVSPLVLLSLGVLTALAGPGTCGCLGWDALTSTMLILIGFLGWVIVRYSENSMQGDPTRPTLLRWVNAVLGWVVLLVSTNNLALLALAWTATSLSVHPLLTLYGQRPAARLAAHKKFVLGRLADLAMFLALALVYHDSGTLQLDSLNAREGIELGPAWQAAACLVAGAAVLKSGQLPFHGWLIQVMEAPTPVSALLHAGVVNIAGYLLIRLAPFLSQSPPAQFLLVFFGGLTAVLAALVMTTRYSIKVHLAWSTSAQMGFMLVECGLGAYHLALLHLVAHSLYKAYRFLDAGDTVAHHRRRRLAPRVKPVGPGGWLLACAGSLALGLAVPTSNRLLALLWCLGLLPLLAQSTREFRLLVGATLLASLYAFGHHLSSLLVGSAPLPAQPAAQALAGFYLATLGLLSVWIQISPSGRLACWLYPRALVGFNLDEFFTRVSQALWPAPRVPEARSSACRPLWLAAEVSS